MQPESNYTFDGGWQIDFDFLWPGLDRTAEGRAAWDRLWARIERWKAELRDRERKSMYD